MSTKACLARPDGDTWTGYYVHSDGYPDYIGRAIVEMARMRGVNAVFDHAATAPQGWTRLPDEPSIYHDEPFILSPDQDAGIDWLYLLQSNSCVAVYRASGWGDPDLRRFAHLATIDPSDPDAITDMVVLADVDSDFDGILVRAPARPRSWSEGVRDMSERSAILAPLAKGRWPAVAIPEAGAVLTIGELMARLVAPPCPGWVPWGDRCLVCHRDIPEGQATVYAHLRARVCIDYCSDLVKQLERVGGRSERGRPRPSGDVVTLASGELCNACRMVAGR
jgi:hypothetical protein